MVLNLVRAISTRKYTMGVLRCDSQYFFTLELPWINNSQNISCIPPGTYKCEVWDSTHHGRVILINNVPNRSGILIHKGNSVKDTNGCILVGEVFELGSGTPLTSSRKAFDKLMDLVKSEESLTITVQDPCQFT